MQFTKSEFVCSDEILQVSHIKKCHHQIHSTHFSQLRGFLCGVGMEEESEIDREREMILLFQADAKTTIFYTSTPRVRVVWYCL